MSRMKPIKPGANRRPNGRTDLLVPAARRWARRLAAGVDAVMARHPDADPEDVRLTLISLQSPPLTRLNRSLRRGRGFGSFK